MQGAGEVAQRTGEGRRFGNGFADANEVVQRRGFGIGGRVSMVVVMRERLTTKIANYQVLQAHSVYVATSANAGIGHMSGTTQVPRSHVGQHPVNVVDEGARNIAVGPIDGDIGV